MSQPMPTDAADLRWSGQTGQMEPRRSVQAPLPIAPASAEDD